MSVKFNVLSWARAFSSAAILLGFLSMPFAPLEAAHAQNAQIDGQTATPAAAQTPPVQTAPAQTAPVQTNPVQTAPAQTAPVQTAPVQTAPAQTAPVQTAPVQTAPAQAAPVRTAPQSVKKNVVPPHAPSLLKKAGHKILDSAEKKMLHNIDLRLQSQQNGQTQASGTATVPATSSAPILKFGVVPYRSWINPAQRPLACLLCVHGLGLESNSYEFFGQELSKHGLAVYAIDVRGFGEWMNAGGKTQVDFNQCLDDVKQALQSIRAANPGLPVYVLGESMGGAIALRAASTNPSLIDGLISSVPAGDRFNQGKTSLKVFVNLLAGKNIEDVGQDIVDQATQNQALRTLWQKDPLDRLNLSPQELIQFQDFMNNNHDAATSVTNMPVLFIQGNGDQLVKPEGTWELFNAVASKDKSFFAVPGEHLIIEDAQTQDAKTREQNFRVITSWLYSKLGLPLPTL